jgi:hypothetical protein
VEELWTRACALDTGARKHKLLKQHTIKQWRIKGFPHSIYFRITDEAITLETIYAHRMERDQFYADIDADI